MSTTVTGDAATAMMFELYLPAVICTNGGGHAYAAIYQDDNTSVLWAWSRIGFGGGSVGGQPLSTSNWPVAGVTVRKKIPSFAGTKLLDFKFVNQNIGDGAVIRIEADTNAKAFMRITWA